MKTYHGQDPAGWQMSEKFDGVCGCWDGKTLKTKHDNTIYAPDWWLAQLPRLESPPIWGEVWSTRDNFQWLVGRVKRHVPNDEDWQKICFRPFEQHSNMIIQNNVWQPFEHYLCTDLEAMEDFYDYVVNDLKGEGIVLVDPSGEAWKKKPEHTDECCVTGYEAGKGKHLGRIGALLCEWNGKIIKLGTGLKDADRENPPAIDAMVTFGFTSLTDNGMPRFPKFICERSYE